MEQKKDVYKKSRVLYIISATLEYFISILTGTAYLAKIAGSIGISDGTIGVLSSFTALGCAFQIVSLAMRTDRAVKPRALTINLINQLCFTLLYVIPVVDLPKDIKTLLFTALLLCGNILLNVPFSLKATWSKSLVEDKRRGIFAASCEITSLVSGMVFTTVAGRMIDSFEAKGNQAGAFAVCAVTLLVLTVSHALCLLFIREDKLPSDSEKPIAERLKGAITDRTTLLLLPLFVLWNATQYVTIPFFGTYQINDLGFSMTAVSLISVGYALIRALASAPLGMLGDKRSFVTSMSLSLVAMTVGLTVNSLGGKVSHIIFYILYAVTLAGMNSGIMNVIFDYVDREKRNGAVAILYTVGGLVGFAATLAVKPIVDYVQKNGNSFLFFDHIYAQQILSILGAALALATLAYINTVVKRLDKVEY
ncbi:MAG: MFS transporter [Clostridia bacterium]|nr:MFS transporter [Clostridia bacterium]